MARSWGAAGQPVSQSPRQPEPERELQSRNLRLGLRSSQFGAAERGGDQEGLLPLGLQARLFAECARQGAGKADGAFEQGQRGTAVNVAFQGVDKVRVARDG